MKTTRQRSLILGVGLVLALGWGVEPTKAQWGGESYPVIVPGPGDPEYAVPWYPGERDGAADGRSWRGWVEPRGYARPAFPRTSTAAALALQIAAETQAFIAVFGPTADRVPSGERMLSDAIDLRDAASELGRMLQINPFDRDVRRLADRVERHGERLVDRVARVARGRLGPNIQQVYRIGDLCNQLAVALSGWRR